VSGHGKKPAYPNALVRFVRAPSPDSLGPLVRNARAEAGRSLGDVARALRCSPIELSQFEDGTLVIAGAPGSFEVVRHTLVLWRAATGRSALDEHPVQPPRLARAA
jgi:hypothetical protein